MDAFGEPQEQGQIEEHEQEEYQGNNLKKPKKFLALSFLKIHRKQLVKGNSRQP